MNHLTSLGALRVSLLAAMGLTACTSNDAVQPAAQSSGAVTTGAGGASMTSGSTSAASTTGAAGVGGSPSSSITTGVGSSGGAGGMGGASSTGAGGMGGANGTSSTSAASTSTASTSAATSSASSSSGAGGSPTDASCVGGTPALDANGGVTGFVKCADGTVHREQAMACDPTAGAPACSGTEEAIECGSDADCTAQPNGRCASYPGYGAWGSPKTICGCTYPCINDAECGAGKVCVCGGVVENHFNPWSKCAAAACASDASCASGQCGVVFVAGACGYGTQALACRTAADSCRLNADCVTPGTLCSLDSVTPSSWQCIAPPGCGIGRPLLAFGRARTARAAARDDWAAGDAGVDIRELDAPTRAALGQHWRSIAALEHASVASFARFTLHLLALGAPPTLVAEAQRAGLDEVEHARLAYGLAGAYGGAPVGPAPLDLTGVDFTAARGDVLRALIHEACVGETLAAAEAGALAARVRDPALRRLHARIAADEQRHAELGWRALAWMLQGEGAASVDHAERCFEEAIVSAQRRPAPVPLTAPEHGLVSEHELAAMHAQALREVVAPCMAAALAAARAWL